MPNLTNVGQVKCNSSYSVYLLVSDFSLTDLQRGSKISQPSEKSSLNNVFLLMSWASSLSVPSISVAQMPRIFINI